MDEKGLEYAKKKPEIVIASMQEFSKPKYGVDVLKALGLGARAVLIGRAMLCGLAVAGEEGVTDVLRMFQKEIEVGLALLGCTSPADVSRAHVR